MVCDARAKARLTRGSDAAMLDKSHATYCRSPKIPCWSLLALASVLGACAPEDDESALELTDGGSPVLTADAGQDAGLPWPLDASFPFPGNPDAGGFGGLGDGGSSWALDAASGEEGGAAQTADAGPGGSPGGGSSGGTRPADSKLPQAKGACPTLADGTIMVSGSRVKLWVGSKPGPVYFYFHGTGSNPDEVNQGLPGASAGVKNNGGLVASWAATNTQGSSTGSFWAVWYTGDFDAADQLLACAIQKGIVDTSRIHVAGYSAGGLQTGAMLFMRSNYLASGIIYSGGKGFGAMGLQDPQNAPAVLGAHGKKGSDQLILDFADWTQNAERELKAAGSFAVDCDDGAGHVALSRLGVMGGAMKFLNDHPYGKRPSPYASGLPSGFPSFCKVVQ